MLPKPAVETKSGGDGLLSPAVFKAVTLTLK